MTLKLENIKSVDSVRLICLLADYAGFASGALAQSGLSILAEVSRGEHRWRLLIDAGPDAGPVLTNMKTLGVEPASIGMISLSHNHYDHTGGLEGILTAIGRRTPVVAHPSLFRETFSGVGRRPLRPLGLTPAGRSCLEAAGADFLLAEEPLPLAPGVYCTGAIEQALDFEKPGERDSTFTLRNGRLEPDTGVDDLAVVFNVEGSGLVVVTGCSHAGVINILHTAREVTGVDRIAGVVGGFHLVRSKEERIERTARELSRLGVGRVVAGHCTGFRACSVLARELGERFSVLYSGEAYEFPGG